MLTRQSAELMNLGGCDRSGGGDGRILSQVFGFSAAILGLRPLPVVVAGPVVVDPAALPHRFITLPFDAEVALG